MKTMNKISVGEEVRVPTSMSFSKETGTVIEVTTNSIKIRWPKGEIGIYKLEYVRN